MTASWFSFQKINSAFTFSLVIQQTKTLLLHLVVCTWFYLSNQHISCVLVKWFITNCLLINSFIFNSMKQYISCFFLKFLSFLSIAAKRILTNKSLFMWQESCQFSCILFINNNFQSCLYVILENASSTLLLLLLSHLSHVWLCATLQTAAHQAPPSLGFSRQEHWSGLPFPSPMHESEKWKGSHSVTSDSSQPHGL